MPLVAARADDEWTVVTAADKKRVMRKRGARKSIPRGPSKISVDCCDGCTIQDHRALGRGLDECIEYLLQTSFWKHLIEALQDNEIQQIVCYGIGNFSQTGTTYFSASLWQLSCAVALQRHLVPAPQRMLYFDPCSSAAEIQFVQDALDMHVLDHNERGDHPVGTTATLFFMPHCPARLYENVVWSNYSCAANNHLWILGNSLSRIAETNHCPCLRLMEWEMEASMEPTRRDCDEAPGNFMGAFNDIFLSRMPGSSAGSPPRPYNQLLPLEEDGELI